VKQLHSTNELSSAANHWLYILLMLDIQSLRAYHDFSLSYTPSHTHATVCVTRTFGRMRMT